MGLPIAWQCFLVVASDPLGSHLQPLQTWPASHCFLIRFEDHSQAGLACGLTLQLQGRPGHLTPQGEYTGMTWHVKPANKELCIGIMSLSQI